MSDDWIRSREALDEAVSTNDVARVLAKAGTHELPFLVVARRQTAGRGQRSNVWFSDEGSLTFSLALDPVAMGIEGANWPRIALTAAVAIVDAAERLGAASGSLGIRWPNDVEVLAIEAGRKVAGILPEPVETPLGPRLVLGIGLNVTTDFTKAPEEIQSIATTLANLIRPKPLSALDVVLDVLLETLETRLSELGRGLPSLAMRWANLDLLLGRSVQLKRPTGETIRGVARGIDAAGALRLQSPEGEVRAILAGQVVREK